MKFIYFYIILHYCISFNYFEWNKLNKQINTQFEQDSINQFIKKSKNNNLTLKQRKYYLNRAYQSTLKVKR